MDLEVIYSAALERQYIQSQQKTAPPLTILYPSGRKAIPYERKIRVKALRQRVLAFLNAHPKTYFSALEIARGIGEDTRDMHRKASYSVSDLVRNGVVRRQYVNHRGHKSNPQRYRAR